jgi:hypothetical protein
MRTRRETAEHPFGTPKMRMGATFSTDNEPPGSDGDSGKMARNGKVAHG